MHDAHARFEAVVGEPVEVSRRESRWLAMGSERVAFGADDDTGWKRLEREAWLLERWRAAGVPVPRVLRADATRRVQVRERLHGVTGEVVEPRAYGCEPPAVRVRLDGAPLTAFGERLAASYGELAARIRRAVSLADGVAAGLGPTSHRTLDLDDAIARLHASSASTAAKVAAERARAWLTAIPQADAVIHGDLHFHNMVLAEDGTITGVFDLGDSGLDAAATELLYAPSLGSRFLAIALDAYGAIDVEAVSRAHLRTALDHLIWHGPGTPRHASIVEWITAALERLA